MIHRCIRRLALELVSAAVLFAAPAAYAAGPAQLKVDNLPAPLGLDNPAPLFSWQIASTEPGARQSAYQLQVGSSEALLQADKADIWTSGRIAASTSIGIRYQGPALKPSTIYFWRVKAWDANGKPYATSAISHWETGLMDQANWKADWIGYLTAEETTIRQAPSAWINSPFSAKLAAEKLTQERYAFRTSIKLTRRGATSIFGLRPFCYLALAQYLAGEWDEVLLAAEQGFSAAAIHTRRFELPMLSRSIRRR